MARYTSVVEPSDTTSLCFRIGGYKGQPFDFLTLGIRLDDISTYLEFDLQRFRKHLYECEVPEVVAGEGARSSLVCSVAPAPSAEQRLASEDEYQIETFDWFAQVETEDLEGFKRCRP